MQKYSTYKHTDIEWLGDVPSHWKVDTLKNHCDIFASNVDKKTEAGEVEVTLCNYVDVYKNLQIDTSIEFMKATATQAEIEKFTLKLNDIILTKDSETPDDIATPAIVKEVFENFLCGYHLSIIRCLKKIEPDFLIWVLRDLNIATQFHREAIGITRFALASKHFKNGVITFPDRTEQIAIASYLNQTTNNIDKVIATKQQQLEKLEQYKKSKIHECVTKGLDANVTLKPSGIEWIGDVPLAWKIVKFSQVIFVKHGYQFRDYDFTEDGIKIIKITQVKVDGTLDIENTSFISSDRLYEFNDYRINEGDILMALTGGTIGKIIRVEEVNEPLLQNYRVGNFFPSDRKLDKRFMFWVLSSELTLSQIFFYVRETGQPNIGKEDFGKMKLALPQLIDQNKIADYLDNFCSNLYKAKKSIEQQIEKLKLYRKCLIHECVTGKRKITDD